MMKWIILVVLLYPSIKCEEPLEILSKTRTSYLQKYSGYVDVVVMHLEIPKETSFAAFKFTADEAKRSIFACSPRKVIVYMKHKSLPVINPDGSKFPSSFRNITRAKYYYMELSTDKSTTYLNLTSPDPGCYFVTAFLPYVNPKHEAIRPPGLTSECYAFVETTLYIRRRTNIDQVVDGVTYVVDTYTNQSALYNFFVPDYVTHAVLVAEEIFFAENSKKLIIKVSSRSIPSANNAIGASVIESSLNQSVIAIPFGTEGDNWHFVEFIFQGPSSPNEVKSSLQFTIKYFFEETELENRTTWRTFNSRKITEVIRYKQYDLVRESNTESFSYSYELRQKFTISSTVSINLTNNEFAVLRFRLRQHTDIGGTLQYSLSFKPRVNKVKKIIEDEPSDHKIIACIRPEAPELPTWPHFCSYEGDKLAAPLILNKTTDNSSMMIPYPESGIWYATFKLFCGECVPCSCPSNCQKEFEGCVDACLTNCDNKESCRNCSLGCKSEVVKKRGCDGCDCDGPCLRSKKACNSSVVFDVVSMACANDCGRHGRCMFMVCDAVVYATCVCSNNFKGWDCSDGSEATSYAMMVVELLLLVLSNLMFLPTVYVAYRRKYYVEAIVYFSIFFFSTFYHACDAGENIISFCITRLAALQFADFYCALLSIWVTLIAIADLPSYWPTIWHITGAIILSFTTTINKTAMWGFALPVITGIVIVGINWFLKWRKIRQMFLNKRYLYIWVPIGVVVVTVGLVIFIFLETADNYKYLHSMWHVIMAIAVIILLPRPNTFQPPTQL